MVNEDLQQRNSRKIGKISLNIEVTHVPLDAIFSVREEYTAATWYRS